MSEIRVLLTGDYWHPDFQDVVREFEVPLTLVPSAQLLQLDLEQSRFDLVVIAQSRRGQVPQPLVDLVLQHFPNTPLINLLGSWCEGETRSGEPHQGLVRVCWHQWRGRYRNFLSQLSQRQLADWQMPKIASLADRVLNRSARVFPRSSECVGISTWSREAFDMLADAIDSIGYSSRWFEHEGIDEANAVAMLIDGNSLTERLKQRIFEISVEISSVPKMLTLNFPRRDEVDLAQRMGIDEVISKPFDLSDLQQAIERLDTATAIC